MSEPAPPATASATETTGANAGALNPSVQHTAVVLLHGIRTRARWMGPLSEKLEEKLGKAGEVYTIKYGYFDLFRFLIPGLFADRYLNRVSRELDTLQQRHPGARIVLIAHSFGTYLVSRVLNDRPSLSVDLLIFCGSVVPDTYQWQHVVGRVPTILNECGMRDPWPVIASRVTWGYGPSGVYGCGTVGVRDRYHDLGHSDFLTVAFFEKYWWPVIDQGTVLPTSHTLPEKLDWWMELLGWLPLRWLIVAFAGVALVLGLAAAAWAYERECEKPTVVVTGRVLTPGGDPAAGAGVWIPPMPEPEPARSDGRFTIELPNPGEKRDLTIKARLGGGPVRVEELRVRGCRVNAGTIKLDP